MIILIVDGCSRGNPGPMSYGYVVWDRVNSRRMTPVHRHSEWKGYGTAPESEYQAIIEGLKYVISKYSNQPVFIYCDSQLVIYQINEKWQCKHENIKPLFAEVKDWSVKAASKGLDLNFCWVPRQLTVLADKEANRREEQDAVSNL